MSVGSGDRDKLAHEITIRILGSRPRRRRRAPTPRRNYGLWTVTVAEMEELCPACAEQMRAKNMDAVKYRVSPPGRMPAHLVTALCGKFKPDEGFRTRCMASDVAKNRAAEGWDKAAFCQWLEQACKTTGQL